MFIHKCSISTNLSGEVGCVSVGVFEVFVDVEAAISLPHQVVSHLHHTAVDLVVR